MIDVSFKDFDEAWLGVNKLFIEDPSVTDHKHGLRNFSYDNRVDIRNVRCVLDPGLLSSFTKLKWTLLLKSYMDWESLYWVKARLDDKMNREKKVSVKVLGGRFLDRRNSNGACLIGYTVRVDQRSDAVSFRFYNRVSETARRMVMDYILFYRIIQFILPGYKNYDVDVSIIGEALYQTGENVHTLNRVMDLRSMGIDPAIPSEEFDNWYHKACSRHWQRCLSADLDKIKYMTQRRGAKRAQEDYEGVGPVSLPISKCVFPPYTPEQPYIARNSKNQLVIAGTNELA